MKITETAESFPDCNKKQQNNIHRLVSTNSITTIYYHRRLHVHVRVHACVFLVPSFMLAVIMLVVGANICWIITRRNHHITAIIFIIIVVTFGQRFIINIYGRSMTTG
jgi:hypothetical protein